MLVLARKEREEIIVKLPDGRLVVISVVEIRGDKARLGIKADADIEIDRSEVHFRKMTEGKLS